MNQLHWLSDCMRGKQKLFVLAMAMGMALCYSLLYLAYPFLTRTLTDRVLVGIPQPDATRAEIDRQPTLSVPATRLCTFRIGKFWNSAAIGS